MRDLIDREKFIYTLIFSEKTKSIFVKDLRSVIEVANEMPSAEPERKKGQWKMHSDYPDRLICSECTGQFDVWHWESKQMHFCPNCGAEMINRGE